MFRESQVKLADGHNISIYNAGTEEQEITVTSYGARLLKWEVPCTEAENERLNLIVNHADYNHYAADPAYMGAVIGPIPNRFASGKIHLAGNDYQLEQNVSPDTLHSSNIAFSELDFELFDHGEDYIILKHEFTPEHVLHPGNRILYVSYILQTNSQGKTLKINYKLTTSSDCYIDVTNHSYFRLWDRSILQKYDISPKEALLQTRVKMPSAFYTPTDNLICTGEILHIKENSILDFQNGRTLADGIKELAATTIGGYDHNFILARDYHNYDSASSRYYSKPTTFASNFNNVSLSAVTTEVGAQLYTANYLDADVTSDGMEYGKHCAFCFETQGIPNNVVYDHFPSTLLRAGDTYNSTTLFTYRQKL